MLAHYYRLHRQAGKKKIYARLRTVYYRPYMVVDVAATVHACFPWGKK